MSVEAAIAIFTALDKGTSTIKKLKDFIQNSNDNSIKELKNQFMDLIELHYSARIAIVELDKELRETKEKLENAEKMKFDGKFYYIEGEEFPYCPGCWGAKKRQTHLVIDKGNSGASYICPVADCKFSHYVDNPNWNPPRYAEDSGWQGS